jgi:hypothetical protein
MMSLTSVDVERLEGPLSTGSLDGSVRVGSRNSPIRLARSKSGSMRTWSSAGSGAERVETLLKQALDLVRGHGMKAQRDGFGPPIYDRRVLLFYGSWVVLLVMAWGMLDAAYHRDSIWREADQNKVVWVLVQFIPFVGTMAYYILVHRTLLEAEDRVRRS